MLQQKAHKDTLNRTIATIAALLLSMSIANAAEPAATCKVRFAATLNNQPMLAPTVTTIRTGGNIAFESKQHSFTTALACGKTYVATVTSGKTTRTREFRTLPYNKITVEMGAVK